MIYSSQFNFTLTEPLLESIMPVTLLKQISTALQVPYMPCRCVGASLLCA